MSESDLNLKALSPEAKQRVIDNVRGYVEDNRKFVEMQRAQPLEQPRPQVKKPPKGRRPSSR